MPSQGMVLGRGERRQELARRSAGWPVASRTPDTGRHKPLSAQAIPPNPYAENRPEFRWNGGGLGVLSDGSDYQPAWTNASAGGGVTKPDVTLITPTGDRPIPFALCERWMKKQTFDGSVQWIVVDDGAEPTTCTLGQQYIRRAPQPDDPRHTLARNLLTAIPHIRSDKILIIEDDDWYSPWYIEKMLPALTDADLVGLRDQIYYRIRDREWRLCPGTRRRASMCQTGMTSVVVPTLQAVCQDDFRATDIRLWRDWNGSRHFLPLQSSEKLSIGLKQLPGRKGQTSGWRKHPRGYAADNSEEFLKAWLGVDLEAYFSHIDASQSRTYDKYNHIVVYTAIFGDCDKLRPVGIHDPGVRYVCFTDRRVESKGWEVIVCDLTESTPVRENRKYKLQPFQLFPGADWVIYIDGSMATKMKASEIIDDLSSRFGRGIDLFCSTHPLGHNAYRDGEWVIRKRFTSSYIIDRQLANYRAEGLPDSQATGECCFLVSRNTDAIHRFYAIWDSQVQSFSHRDQTSFPYAVWKSEINLYLFPRRMRSKYVSRRRHLKKRVVLPIDSNGEDRLTVGASNSTIFMPSSRSNHWRGSVLPRTVRRKQLSKFKHKTLLPCNDDQDHIRNNIVTAID